jgi:hypothetical protein
MKYLSLYSICVISLLFATVSLVSAQSGGGYELSRAVVSSGSGQSSGGAYSLTSTLGQPEAGAAQNGGDYNLGGGFWGGGQEPEQKIYLPLLVKGS